MDQIMNLIEQPELWMLPLNGWGVTQCRIDYAFGLELEHAEIPHVHIRIGETFILKMNGNEYKLNAQKDPTLLAPALAILHQKIESVLAFKKGTLEVNLSNDIHIFVPPDIQYEAWELSGPSGLLIVCRPGGSLSIWPPKA